MALSSVGMPTNRSTSSDSPSLNRVPPPGSPLLLVSTDPESDVEVGMVPARFSLRPRTAGPRTGRREGFVRTPRYRQDQPHRAQRHFSNQPRRVRPSQPVGRTVRGFGFECFSLQPCGGNPMTYSYTQISQYLSCPRRYRHRYLDGWQEKDTRAAMLFGRAFEQAVAALFRREDPASVLFEQWSACKVMGLI